MCCDLLLAGNNMPVINHIRSVLDATIRIKDLENLKYSLVLKLQDLSMVFLFINASIS